VHFWQRCLQLLLLLLLLDLCLLQRPTKQTEPCVSIDRNLFATCCCSLLLLAFLPAGLLLLLRQWLCY
jgi:hypothetical protein